MTDQPIDPTVEVVEEEQVPTTAPLDYDPAVQEEDA